MVKDIFCRGNDKRANKWTDGLYERVVESKESLPQGPPMAWKILLRNKFAPSRRRRKRTQVVARSGTVALHWVLGVVWATVLHLHLTTSHSIIAIIAGPGVLCQDKYIDKYVCEFLECRLHPLHPSDQIIHKSPLYCPFGDPTWDEQIPPQLQDTRIHTMCTRFFDSKHLSCSMCIYMHTCTCIHIHVYIIYLYLYTTTLYVCVGVLICMSALYLSV